MARGEALSRVSLFVMGIFISAAVGAYGGNNVWTSNGPYGGNVLLAVVNPSNPATVYAAIDYGGVFKSTNGGTSYWYMNVPTVVDVTLLVTFTSSQAEQ
ncbi:MAG: hypothetical protein AB1714_19035 [Acidobacteriota bacterium]